MTTLDKFMLGIGAPTQRIIVHGTLEGQFIAECPVCNEMIHVWGEPNEVLTDTICPHFQGAFSTDNLDVKELYFR